MDWLENFKKLVKKTSINGPKPSVTPQWKAYYYLTALMKPDIVVECGVRIGCSFQAFLAGLVDNGEIYGFDINHPEGARAGGDPEYARITCRDPHIFSHKRVHFSRTDSLKAYEKWDKDKKIDILHIDNNHSYEHVVQELKEWSKVIAQDGVIILHDTIYCKSVIRAIRDWRIKNTEWEAINCDRGNGVCYLTRSAETLEKIHKAQELMHNEDITTI
jgi:predicted O-methyltransferase YrrM